MLQQTKTRSTINFLCKTRMMGCLSLLSELWTYVVFFVTVAQAGNKLYALDDNNVCRRDGIVAYYLSDKDYVLILAQFHEIRHTVNVQSCALILGPSSDSNKKYTRVEFESFHMPDCEVEIILEESPSMTFDRDITPLRKLGCRSKNPKVIMSHEGKLIKISLIRKKLSDVKKYNFRLNVTLSKDGPNIEVDGISLGLKIGIATICVISAFLLILLVYKTVKLRISVRKDYLEDCNNRLTDLNSHHVTRTNSYTSLPHTAIDDLDETAGTESLYMNSDVESYRGRSAHRHTGGPLLSDSLVSDSPELTLNYYANAIPNLGHTAVVSQRENRNDLPLAPPSYEDALDMPCPSVPHSNN